MKEVKQMQPKWTYKDLWEKVKTERTVTIKLAANSDTLFNRIKRGVIKKKVNDVAYKFELDQTEQVAKLEVVKVGQFVTFKLKLTVSLEDI